MPVSLPEGVVGVSASFRTISFSFEAIRGEYLSRTQWLRKGRPSCSFCTRGLNRTIYIYIYIYIYRRARCTTRTCGARSGSPQILFMKYYGMNIFTVRLWMQLKTTLGWRVDLCQFPTPCSGNGSVRAAKMAYLAMQRFSLIQMIPNSTYFGQRPLFRLFQSGPR